jgi:hypothetical protein
MFRHAVCDMGYGQCNGDHTLFYKHSEQKITILVVSVDDIIDGEAQIARLKGSLSKTFEVKDLGRLKYFLDIEVARSAKGIAISQRKYILDLLSDIGMMGCQTAPTPIDHNHKVTPSGTCRQRKISEVGWKAIILCHTRLDIAYVVSVVSRYMHKPRSGHMEAAHRILWYLKGTRGKGVCSKVMDILLGMAIAMQIRQVV